jgi:hypothetical protein
MPKETKGDKSFSQFFRKCSIGTDMWFPLKEKETVEH